MIPLRLGEIEGAALVRGNPELTVRSLTCDSRLARPGSLFVCLRGARCDGHDFLPEAARRGALAALCERGRARPPPGVALLEAEDPLAALADIGRLVRRRAQASIAGIAGSAGKTTTKDVLRALLAPHLPVAASPASYNNELGVPLTLSLLEQETRVCVCELGTGAPGELASLCRIAEPDLGLLTSIGPEHLEFFGALTGVAAEEAELIGALRPGAPLVLPHGEPLLDPYRRADLDEWSFGLDPDADVYPLRWRPGDRLAEVVLSVRGRQVAFRTNLRLPHHRLNLAAAVAAYAALGLPLRGVGLGAASIALSPWRGEEHPRPGGGLLINDAYNANPLSMRTALEALAARGNGARTVAILGEMDELGAEARGWHALAGAQAAALSVDLLVAVGPLARAYLENAVGRIECRWFPDRRAVAKALPQLLCASDIVLLKGSRSAGLECLAEVILR